MRLAWEVPEKVTKTSRDIGTNPILEQHSITLGYVFVPECICVAPGPQPCPAWSSALHFVFILSPLLPPFCLHFVSFFSACCLHFVSIWFPLFISFNRFGATLHHFWPKSLLWSSIPSLLGQNVALEQHSITFGLKACFGATLHHFWAKSWFWSNPPSLLAQKLVLEQRSIIFGHQSPEEFKMTFQRPSERHLASRAQKSSK